MQNYDSVNDLSHWNEASENVLSVHFPLHRACRDGDLDAVQNYLDTQNFQSFNFNGLRAVFDEDSFYGWTPIHYAAYFGRLACLRKLLTLQTFISPDIKTNRFRQTPCHLAAFGGNIECLKWLLDSRASLFAKDYLGETPLHKAARSGSIECLSLLVAHGANLSSPNNAGQTPLDVAEMCNQKECAVYLRQNHLLQNKTCVPMNEDVEKIDNGVFSCNGVNEQNCPLVTIGGYGYLNLTNGSPAADGPMIDDVMTDHGVMANTIPVAGRKRTRADDNNGFFIAKRFKPNDAAAVPISCEQGFTLMASDTVMTHGCIF